jgi:integrase
MLEGKGNSDARMFLNDYLDAWLAGQLEIGPRTLSDYTGLLAAYVKPTIGILRLSDIRAADVRKLYKGLLDKGLSARTVRYVHTVLSKALKEAECLDANPCSKVKLPKLRPSKPQFLTAEQVNQFLKAAQNDRLYALFVVAVHSGMRPSELLALRWQDVNIDTGLVAIQRGLTWNRKGGGYQVGNLKTISSQRCIVLPPSALQALAKHRIAQHQERLALGSDYKNHDLVFSTTIGTPLQPRNVIARHLKPILANAALPSIRWYDLRHTTASLLLHSGTNPKIVAEKLGHSSVNLTLNVYSHTIPSMQHDAAQTLENALAG